MYKKVTYFWQIILLKLVKLTKAICIIISVFFICETKSHLNSIWRNWFEGRIYSSAIQSNIKKKHEMCILTRKYSCKNSVN